MVQISKMILWKLKKKIIMLSGPTDFYESSKINNLYKIIPNKFCKIHKNKLNAFNKNCNCMKNIDVKKVLEKIHSQIQF